ncbi:MAG: HEAT repeat domain-containing protein [Elusimicrobiaceae bacterium]|nr:HEAT repeat domain-containing protein [Elusimicrobiaceae bacterium]
MKLSRILPVFLLLISPCAAARAAKSPHAARKKNAAAKTKPAGATYLVPVKISTAGYKHLWGTETDDRLISYLGHETPELRAEAATELGRRQCMPAVGALIIRLTDSSPLASSAAVTALAGYADQSVSKDLLDELDSPDEPLVKKVIFTLGRRGDPATRDRLSLIVRKGPDQYRADAAAALGVMGLNQAGESLLFVVDASKDNPPELVLSCIDSLRRIYYPRAIPALMELAQEKHGPFRAPAFNTLCAMRNRAAWPLFVQQLNTPQRAAALDCIRNLRDDTLADKLKRLLKSKDSGESSAAAQLLAEMDTPEIIEYLLTLDDDQYTDEAIKAARSEVKKRHLIPHEEQ